MDPKIIGTVLPVLELNMQPGEKVFAESGQLSWMSMAIQMQTSTTAGGQQGGFLGALGRAVAGGTLFMTEYTAAGGPGLLTFSAKLPGQILPMEVTPSSGYMVHRHGFMCGTPVDFDAASRSCDRRVPASPRVGKQLAGRLTAFGRLGRWNQRSSAW